MGTQDLTFAFAGDERVGAGVSGLLEAAGYPATDISNADVVFTYCTNTSALEDLYYDTEGLLRVTYSPRSVVFPRGSSGCSQ